MATQICVIFTPIPGEIQFDGPHIFQMGLVQPATSLGSWILTLVCQDHWNLLRLKSWNLKSLAWIDFFGRWFSTMSNHHSENNTRWWFQILFIFTLTWGNDPIWRAYFSDGLKPPTRICSSFTFYNHLLSKSNDFCCPEKKPRSAGPIKYLLIF